MSYNDDHIKKCFLMSYSYNFIQNYYIFQRCCFKKKFIS